MTFFPSEDESIENAELSDPTADVFAFPASFAQERLWFTEQMNPGDSAYTIPIALRLDGPLDVAALNRSVQAIIARHEALRTTFLLLDGQLLQTVASSLTIPVPLDDLALEPPIDDAALQARITAEVAQPFDLQHGPLLRARLLRLHPEGTRDEHVLVLSLHHLIADGWSLGVLLRELAQLYPAACADAALDAKQLSALLPPLPIQYADYALWEREHWTAERLAQAGSYWQQQLRGAPTVLDLPTDRPRPPLPSFRGARLPLALSPELSEQIIGFSQRMGVTMFMTLVTALATLLSRYSGQRDLLIGTPVAERTRPETRQLIGLLINTLVLRCDLTGDPTGAQALQRMRRTCLDAYAHQELPFGHVVELLQPERDPSRSPLVQVLFAWQNLPPMQLQLGAVAASLLPVESGTAQFDLTLNLSETASGISGVLEYNTDLFDAATILRLADQFQRLLAALVADPSRRLRQIPLLSPAEQQLLRDWNAAAQPLPPLTAIHHLVEQQAARTPEVIALRADDETLSYAALNARANQLAHALRDRGIRPETRVGIASTPSLELIVALLAVLKAGAAYVPLDPADPPDRLRAIAHDAQLRLLLAQPQLLDLLAPLAVACLALDPHGAAVAAYPATNLPPLPSADALAYLIYTSGSTGSPKAVLLPHRGVLNNLLWRQRTWPLTPADRLLLNYPITFDPSVWNIFWPLSAGAQLVLVRPEVRADSAALVATLAAQQITVFSASPSQHAVLIEEPGFAACTQLRYAVTGGEALPPALLQRWPQRSQAMLCNCYGPTETTIDATCWVCPRENLPPTTRIGRPLPNVQVYVLDEQMQPLPIGVPGELYIGGSGLARGYHGRPDLTAAQFVPDPFAQTPGARLYRSGDRGRWHADGTLEFLGRLDQQVKLRGFRIEPGEIAAALRRHPVVAQAAVVLREDRPGLRQLVAYVTEEPRNRWPAGCTSEQNASLASELRQFLKDRLPAYMLPSAFVVLDHLPLTPNGKLDPAALPAPEDQRSAQDAAYTAPRSAAEHTLAMIWQALLQVERVGIHDSFFALGGHSLLVMQLMARIRAAFEVELPVRCLFETPTIAGLALVVEQAVQQQQRHLLPAIPPASRDQPLPLSFAQERLWFVEQLDATVSAYTMPLVLRLRGPLDLAALEHSIHLLIQRHETLRTSFAVGENGPVQVIAPAEPAPLRLIQLPSDSRPADVEQQMMAELRAPFDLTTGPLLRVTLLRQAPSEQILAIALHHIIADGWSITIFVRELAALYTHLIQAPGSASALLPPLPIQYADFAVWQRSATQQSIHAAQLDYWRQQLGPVSSVALELPIDYPRPPLQTFHGNQMPLRIDPTTTAALHKLSRQHDASLFMTLLAAFNVLLHRYSGQTDILVGTPVANRSQPETEGLIGLLLNMLVLRADLSDDPRLDELLARTREVCLQAYAHQDVPFEQVVEALQPARDLSRNPLFQVAFFWQNLPAVLPKLADLQVESLPVATNTAQFELTLNLSESADGIQGVVEYNSDLFAAPTIARLIQHYVTLLQALVAEPTQRVSRVPLLSAAEQQSLLRDWNMTALPSPDACIHELIAAQAERTPDAIALVHEAAALSYSQLLRRAAQLAARLQSHGVGPDTRVGMCLPRTPDLVVAMLATLLAGGCYVPLDPSYPRERLQFMLQDAGVAVVLTTSELQAALGRSSAQIVCLDADDGSQAEQQVADNGVTPDNLAYIIYTSGSTGRPKGVMVTHRNVVNFFAAMDERIGAEQPGTWLALTSVSFDISVLELLWTLARGCKVVLQDERSHSQPVDPVATRPIDFSLFYFASANHAEGEIYRLLLEGAQFADQHGFAAVWTPERHFHAFGGLYPNPSVMSAALATLTKRIQIRAGSVVLPLHSPIRVAEEWAIVDHLSQGRVGVSFASGWHSDDFVFAPERYAGRKQAMLDGVETIRRLWRGEALPFAGGAGHPVQVRILPRPIQPELPIWLTAAGNPETFRIAGEIGASVLTHLLGQSVEELTEKIALYRRAWQSAGHAGTGHVTLMIHTFVDDDPASVREIVREPFRSYLRNSVDLLDQLARGLGLELRAEQLTAADMDSLLDHAFERYFETSGLFGTPDTCLQQINRLKASGIDEVACLIDFGVATDTVLASLPLLDELRRRSNPAATTAPIDYSLPAQLVRHQVTHLQCTPSQARMLLADQEALPAWRSLRSLLLGGEALPVDLARQVRDQIPAKLHNMYGPTETTIWSSTHHVETIAGSVPLGRPIGNTQMYILDRQLQPLPQGVAGELFIGGAGVVRGYHGRPDLTAERFIPDPFGDVPGARLYKTGDRARYRADGVIEFLGRVDQQIKLRGYRIEPGEIETALLEHPQIRQAAVVVRADEATQARLIAYIVPSEPAIAPLKPVLSPEEQARLLNGRATYTMPNGMPIVHFGDLGVSNGYREVIEDATYLKYGIEIPPGACVFDVGANIGFFSLFASQRCPDVNIYAFEPIPPTYAALQLNVALYGLNVRAFPIGLAARRESASFTFYPSMPGLSGRYADLDQDKLATKAIILNDQDYASANQADPSLAEAELDEILALQFHSETYTCQLSTLSEVIQEHKVTRIDLLKIDVERAEVDVLRGLREEDWAKIRQVVLEVDTRENLAQIVALLEGHGFHLIVDDFVVVPPDERQPGVYVYMVYASRAPLHKDQGQQPLTNSTLLTGELREFLLARLPEYMVPSAFVTLPALPLTPNGKLDRRALPEPSSIRPALAVHYVAPRNELEQRIAAVWQELLQLEKLGIHDNFFELGGTSLLLVQARTRLRAALDRDLSLVELFQYPTISALAQHLNTSRQQPASAAMDKVRQQAERQKQARQQKRSSRRSIS
jgi:natural product biosynthesis luciferase-like monooxygenase protein/amino acid adenylation domain-containing protein/FkbM family methyltransferase